MLRAIARASQLRIRLPQAAAGRRALTASLNCNKYEDEHVMITEQDQGHILEKLEDPAEVQRMLRHMRSKSTFGDTMTDTILRESLEARKADFERQQADKYKKVVCQQDHDHDFCCGGRSDEVAAGE